MAGSLRPRGRDGARVSTCTDELSILVPLTSSYVGRACVTAPAQMPARRAANPDEGPVGFRRCRVLGLSVVDSKRRVCVRALGEDAREIRSLSVADELVELCKTAGAVRARLDGRLRLALPRWVAHVVGLDRGDRIAIVELPPCRTVLVRVDRLAVSLQSP